ncbi:hypothetical protein VNO80_31658 [Phaseolus coccineus]|uniref:Uncharacterized protein n=1 Tax=Phaseolus coccineus TaxID=3886 RepID=A0AAN9Q748_PHACN
MQWILAMSAPEEGSSSNVQKLKIEDTTNIKSLSQHDLQSIGNEIGTGNTETSNGMKTSVNTENIPEFSPYFQSEYGMMGDYGKGIGDGIVAKTTILPLSFLKEGSLIIIQKPKLTKEAIDINKKSLIEPDLSGSGNEFGTGNSKTCNVKSTPEKHEKVPMLFANIQNDYEKEGGNGKGILALPAPEEGNVVDVRKSQRKNEEADNRKRLIEPNFKRSGNANMTTNNEKKGVHGTKGDNLEENAEEIVIGKIKSKSKSSLEKHKPQGDNEEKIHVELGCHESHEKIKSKRRRRSKKHEPLGDNEKNIDHKSSYVGFDIGFGEDKLPPCEELKSKEKKKVDENDDAETSKFKHKKCEPQGDNREKIDPELCYGSAGKGDQTAVEKIKSKKKRRSMKCEAQVPKPSCDGYDIRFIENMQLENGKIKSMEKKAVEDELQETVDGTKTSKFKLKKTEPEVQKNTVQVGVRYVSPFHNDSSKKIPAKQLDNGSNPEPFAFPISKDLMGDKVEEDGSRVEINQQGQEGCLFSVVLTSAANGNGFESISIKLKKKTVESAMVGKACHCSQIDNVEKSVEVEALEHGQGLKGNGNGNDIETIKVKFKKRKSNDEKTARSMNDKVRKVCPSSQNDNEKRANVKAVHDENDFDSGAIEG